MADLRIGTRRSNLALAQSRRIAERLAVVHPGLSIDFVEIVTSGDRDRRSPVTSLTELGAFVRAVQEAVLSGEADVAVHSCKDLPVEGPGGLEVFYPERAAPWDVLCGGGLSELPSGAKVGTGSPRRAAQLAALRPDLIVEDIRGNVETRLAKVASGEYRAVVLAEAGLRRLGLEGAITHRFTIDEMVPAPAQAAIAVEVAPGGHAASLVAAIDEPETRLVVEAERSVLSLTGAGCRAALGVVGEIVGRDIHLRGFVHDGAGPRRGSARGATPDEAARRLVAELAL